MGLTAAMRDVPTPDTLPRSLPIFPLTGVLLLPRGRLPLNIFEPRYLNMFDDALRGDRLIGIIQPTAGDTESPQGAPPVFETGCAGRITSFSETDDGRYVVTLTGVSRFHVSEELTTIRGYRRVIPDWAPFAADLTETPGCAVDRARLTQLLKTYFDQQGLSANWESIDSTPDERLITAISMICPFEPNEKQALLEAATLADRAQVMIAVLEMAVASGSGETDRARH